MTSIRKTHWLALVLLSTTAPYTAALAQGVSASAAAGAAVEAVPAPDVVLLPRLESSPSVRAALELPRDEPADYFQAIGWLIDLGRPELAKGILDELAQLQITDAQRAALVEEFGSARMLRLGQTRDLAPTGAAFADACLAAAAAAANDPQRIARLVAQLSDPAPELREIARNDLAAAGRVGVTANLEALAREQAPGRRADLSAAAEEMHPLVVGPLLAMLSTNDPALHVEVSRMLRHLGVAQAIPLLPASPASAERAITEALARYASSTPPFEADESNRTELWHWNDATKRLQSARYPVDEARVIWTARLARALAKLRPENRTYQRQAWLLGVEAAGLISTTGGMLSGIDASLVNDVLADALAANYSRAAVAAAEELGRRMDASVLYTPDGRLSPIAVALADAHRQVRFAALRAIMAMDPASPYPGSSRLPEALAWFAGATGERRAVVAMPTNSAATSLAGMLATLGLDAEATNRGRQTIDSACASADLEMIFVDMDVLVPEIRQVLYELRTNPATGTIPIAVLAADGRLPAAQRVASEHDRVLATPRPRSPQGVARIVDKLSELAGRDAVPAEERAEQARQALTWLAQLQSTRRAFYDLRRAAPAVEAALYQPRASASAITLLLRLGTPDSQRQLASFASQSRLPSGARSDAAQAFRASVAQHGVLLTSDEILLQYERYNASAAADKQTQQILGVILDAIESRRNARGSTPPSGL